MAPLKDIRKAAEDRAAHPSNTPAGHSFETERKRQKAAVGMQFDALEGTRIRKIAAMTEDDSGMPRKLRVAAYCRVSTDDLDQALSIHMQQRVYREKIKANPEWIYAGTYVDNGFSGTNTFHRPGFLKLIDDCRAGKIDMVITKAVSRFARNLLDCIGYIEELSNLDPPVRVFFEQEGLDTSVQTSGIILFVLAMVAEEESHMKSEAINTTGVHGHYRLLTDLPEETDTPLEQATGYSDEVLNLIRFIKKTLQTVIIRFIQMMLDLCAFTRSVVDIIYGVDTKQQVAVREQYAPNLLQNLKCINFRKVMQTEVTDDDSEHIVIEREFVQYVQASGFKHIRDVLSEIFQCCLRLVTGNYFFAHLHQPQRVVAVTASEIQYWRATGLDHI